MPRSHVLMAVVGALVTLTASALAEQAQSQAPAPAPAQAATVVEQIALTHIEVDARVTGALAEVTVEQTYENSFSERLEAVYVFPLPDDAAVTQMVMLIGERRVVADLQERRRAREIYERARQRGQAASLLEQERPNVFTMSVANIQPGLPIRVLVRYVEEVPFSDGRYRFHFPTVVGPRFIPGTPHGHSGTGAIDDTNRVPDASRITPAILPEGTRTPYEVDFSLDLRAGMAVTSPFSPSHDLQIAHQSDRHVTATLPSHQRQPDRDIQLTYGLAAGAPAAGIMTHFDRRRGGFFTLTLQPPADFDQEDVRPKELIFVLDTSGSMSGYPIATARAAIRHALDHLNPQDTFQIVRFSDGASRLSPVPLANTPENVRQGIHFLDTHRGGGGTVMSAGIRAALTPPADPERMRIVLFLTDGYIGNDNQVLSLIRRHVGNARLFSLGVGSSVNRYLLDRMAEEGRGTVQYVANGEAADEVVETFYDRIRHPVLTDITVDWGGLQVQEVTPNRILDVFSGTPLQLAGRYTRAGRGTITVRGKHGSQAVELRVPVDLTRVAQDQRAIAHLWARRRIAELQSQYITEPNRARSAVVPLALRFGLLTQYTSFVAVEQRVRANVADPLRTRGVPVALPRGVSGANIGPQLLPQASVAPQGTSSAMGHLMGQSVGYGGLGLRGTGRGGGGLRGRRASTPRLTMGVPTIRTGTASVRGSLSRGVIRRYIRRQMNRIRACYERELTTNPRLQGRVSVRFVIGPSGSVTSAIVSSSTLRTPRAEQCIATAVSRIRFPVVDGGGVVVVTYPFALQPNRR